MKKIIIFLGATVFALMAYSQAEKRTNVVTISHPNVNFSIPLPAYSLVYVESTNTLYRISGYYDTSESVNDAISDGNAIPFMDDPVEDTLKVGSATTSGVVELTATDGDKGELKITTDDYLILDGFARVNLGDNPISSGNSTASGVRSAAFGNSIASATEAFAAVRATASGAYSFAIGFNASATGTYAVSLGYKTEATQNVSSAFGVYAKTSNRIQIAFGSGQIVAGSPAQSSLYHPYLAVTHSDDAWKTLKMESGQEMVLPAKSAWTFEAHVVGTTANAAKQWGYMITGVIDRDNANNTTLRASSVTTLYETDVAFDCQAIADDANEALVIQVKDAGASGDAVRWVARVTTTEVIF
jgi:hypothetical protein